MIYNTEVKRTAEENNNSSDNYEEVVVKVQKILKVNYNFLYFELFFFKFTIYYFIILLYFLYFILNFKINNFFAVQN